MFLFNRKTKVCYGRGEAVMTDDFREFGDCLVYCEAHKKPHKTGWCTVPVYRKVKLEATALVDAYLEAKSLNLEVVE